MVRSSIRQMKACGIRRGLPVWLDARFPGVVLKLLPGFYVRGRFSRKDGSKWTATVAVARLSAR